MRWILAKARQGGPAVLLWIVWKPATIFRILTPVVLLGLAVHKWSSLVPDANIHLDFRLALLLSRVVQQQQEQQHSN